MPSNLRSAATSRVEVLYSSLMRFFRHKYYIRCSALAFTSLLGFVPLVSVLVSLLSHLPITAKVLPKLQHFVFDSFVPAQGEKIYPFIEKFLQQATKLPLSQFVFLIIISMFLLLSIERTLSHIWALDKQRRASMSLLLTWSVLIITPVFIIFSLIISTYIFSLPILASLDLDFLYKHYITHLLPWLSSFAGFSLLYYVMPYEKVKLRHAIFGGLIAMILFEGAKYIFSLYLQLFPTYDAIYGALALVPIFMIWLYMVWCIVIYGAILVSEYAKQMRVSSDNATK